MFQVRVFKDKIITTTTKRHFNAFSDFRLYQIDNWRYYVRHLLWILIKFSRFDEPSELALSGWMLRLDFKYFAFIDLKSEHYNPITKQLYNLLEK